MRSTGKPAPPFGGFEFCGVYRGIVAQNQDPKKLGRVKVRFPWLPSGDAEQSTWGQIVVPMIGPKIGTFTLPDVGDNVAVVFLNGDFNRPLIIGGIWKNDDMKPPEVNASGTNDFRFIKSRAGHRFLLDDTAMVKVVLTDFTNTNYIGVGNYPEAGQAPNKFELKAAPAINGSPTKGVAVCSLQGTVNIWCPNGTLTISGKDVEITASQGANAKAGSSLKVDGKKTDIGSAGGNKLQGGTTTIN